MVWVFSSLLPCCHFYFQRIYIDFDSLSSIFAIYCQNSLWLVFFSFFFFFSDLNSVYNRKNPYFQLDLDQLIPEVIAWCSANGLLFGDRESAGPIFTHLPISLLPIRVISFNKEFTTKKSVFIGMNDKRHKRKKI